MSILCKLSTCKLASFRWLENEFGLQARIVAASPLRLAFEAFRAYSLGLRGTANCRNAGIDLTPGV